MSLHSELDDLQVFYDHVPRDEAETRERIIYPLLKAIGYSTRQILSEKYDHSRQRPDYTISAADCEDGIWYLEAKAWRVQLEDAQVSQALNYANQNGRRWVVLSNGQFWRLYDNDVKGLPERKLVCEAELSDRVGMTELLAVLSPSGFEEDQLSQFARRQRDLKAERELDDVVLSALNAAFRDPNSPVCVSIAETLSTSSRSITSDRIQKVMRDHFALATIRPVSQSVSPPVQFDAGSGDSYDALRQGVEAIIRSTPTVSVESTWKRGIGFLPEEWTRFLPRNGQDTWKGWAMLFWADVEVDGTVKLILLIGPGPQAERERLFRRAQAASFLKTKPNPARKWDTVYKRLFLQPAVPARAVPDALRAFQVEWNDFVSSDLLELRDWFTQESVGSTTP